MMAKAEQKKKEKEKKERALWTAYEKNQESRGGREAGRAGTVRVGSGGERQGRKE